MLRVLSDHETKTGGTSERWDYRLLRSVSGSITPTVEFAFCIEEWQINSARQEN